MNEYLAWKARLEASVSNALYGEVYDAVADEIVAAVETEVYEKYEPKVYKRRGFLGGLADKENIVPYVDGMSLEVVNEASCVTGEPLSGFVAEIVESGEGYTWDVDIDPRPFHSVAERNVVQSGEAERALARGLQRQGYEVL